MGMPESPIIFGNAFFITNSSYLFKDLKYFLDRNSPLSKDMNFMTKYVVLSEKRQLKKDIYLFKSIIIKITE